MINNNNGILIPVGDTDALVNKILYLFNNKSDANNLSLNEIRSMEPLSVDNIIKLWIEIFNLMEG
jgi:glycosyltransferase involved in cell wall biosynthesis